MNFFRPSVQLIRRTVLDGPNLYFLKTITNCDQFNYLVDPNSSTSETVDENGNFIVDINIIQDNELPSNQTILPIAHHINIGALPDSEVIITVNLTVENTQNIESGKEKRGEVTVSTVAAEEESRPIDRLVV